MPDIIPFSERTIGTTVTQTVNARDLHTFLEIRKDYSDWIKAQIKRGHFLENRDYIVFPQKGERENQLVTAIEYHFTFDAAKHIAMMSGAKKGWEVREYFLECERQLLTHIPPPVLLPATYADQLETLRAYADFVESFDLLEDRDKLMLKDIARTLLPQYVGLSRVGEPKQLTEPSGFFLADRVRALGYTPTRKEEATLMSKGLARAVAQEYRQQRGTEPLKSQRFVDGAVRPVFWYRDEEAAWIDPLIQTWCARIGITTE